MFEKVLRTIIIYDNRIYEPVGFYRPRVGESFLATDGHVVEMENSKGTKSSRIIVREIIES